MPQLTLLRGAEQVSADELRAILSERLRLLDWVADERPYGEFIPAVDRVGWRCSWRLLQRDRDGSALILLTLTAPHLVSPVERRYRMVDRQRLISRLRSG